MKKIRLFPPENAVAVRVYDCSIENLELRKKQSIVFESKQSAANYIGVSSNAIDNNLGIDFLNRKGKRIYSKKHNKYFAIRTK